MIVVRWTSQAADDLQAIYDFIERDSPHYAKLVVEELIASIDKLQRFPKMGRIVPERSREDLREVIKGPYRIVYQIGNVVKIQFFELRGYFLLRCSSG